MTITAKITGRGVVVPRDPTSVDADWHWEEGDLGGEVTLRIHDNTGELDIWGDLEQWADESTVKALADAGGWSMSRGEGLAGRTALMDAIVKAVREAAAGSGKATVGLLAPVEEPGGGDGAGKGLAGSGELKPCPFCGEDRASMYERDERYAPYCNGCDEIIGPFLPSEAECAAWWNTRASNH